MDRKNFALMMMSAAGLACTAAVADEIADKLPNVPNRITSMEYGRFGRMNSGGGFGDRAGPTVTVYDNYGHVFSPGHPATYLGVTNHILNKLSLNPGSYGTGYAGDRSVTQMVYSYALISSLASWDMRFTFYNASDVTRTGFGAAGAGMINPNASPFEVLTITGFNPSTICVYGYLTYQGITLNTPIAFPAGVTDFYLDVALVQPGTDGTTPLNSSTLYQDSEVESNVGLSFGSNTAAAFASNLGSPISFATADTALNPASPGTSSLWYGRDNINYDGNFTGDTGAWSASGGVHESRYINTYGAAGYNNVAVSYIFGMSGTVPAPATPASTSLDVGGYLPDGVVNVAGQLTAATPLKFYNFHIKNDVNYANTTFLDIDSENSDNPTVFTLYTPDSLVFDTGAPTGNAYGAGGNANQMSFGVARRPGVGSGAQYSGQDGDLPAGQYYMAVALSGSGFGDGWSFAPVAPAAPSNYYINFNGNNQETFVAPPAVPPTVVAAGDVGILNGGNGLSLADPPGTGATQATTALTCGPGPAGVQWVRFSQTNAIPTTGVSDQTTGNPLRDVTFLDITQPGSSNAGSWNFGLYANTSLLANGTSVSKAGYPYNGNTNGGGSDGPSNCQASFAQLSYGTAPDRGPAPLDTGLTVAGKDLDNQNGSSLASGEYYMGVTLGTAYFNPSRWGVYSTNGSNLTAIVSLTNDNRGPSATCPADFNGDGGVDDKDFVLFVAWYNDFTNAAGDLNGDGVTDDSDFSIFATAYNNLVCS